VILQNFGLRDGIPGTPYNKAVKAVEGIEAILLPIIQEALADEEHLMEQGTVLGRLVQGLRDEGADIMHADCDSKAQYFSTQCLGLVFAGVVLSFLFFCCTTGCLWQTGIQWCGALAHSRA
jgi:hypothetical protein